MSNEELLSTLYNRHAAALSVVAQDDNQRVHIDAARMALALMARELADQALSVLLERNNQALQSVIDLRDNEVVRRQNAEHRIVELDAENARLRTELAAAVDERNFAERRCAELEAERDGLRQQVAQLDADDSALIARIFDRIFEMENEIQASQKRRDELNVENLHLEAELERLRAENAALHKQFSTGG